MPAYISSFDVAIQPNVVAYASPLKVLEYLSIGRAIIAPDLPNIRELLRDRHNALLFDNSDPQHLKELLELVMRDTALRQRLELAAHRTISERGLTWRRNAERVEEIISDLFEPTAGLASSQGEDSR